MANKAKYEKKRNAKRLATAAEQSKFRAIPPVVGDLVQVSKAGCYEGYCGHVVKIEGKIVWIKNEETLAIVTAPLERLVKVPTVLEIWGPGGLTEQIRSHWSPVDERARRTGPKFDGPVETLSISTELFSTKFRPSSFREIEP